MKTFVLFLFCFFMAMNPAFAVEVAPRISDREIIESLIRLEAGIEANRQVLESGIKANCQAIEANRQAIGANQAELLGFMKWRFGLLLTGMFILFGFIMWNRRSTLKLIRSEINRLENSKVRRMVAALRKLSEKDVKMADAMRSAGLL